MQNNDHNPFLVPPAETSTKARIISHIMWPPKTVLRFLPVSSLLFAATLWGLVWYPLRVLEQLGLNGLWTVIVSYTAAMIPGVWLLVRRRHELARAPVHLLGLALAAGWCNVAFIMAVLEGTVVRVMLLFYLSPIWTVIMGWLLLGETMSRRAIGIFSIAMFGAVIMLWDPQTGSFSPRDLADWLALSSGFAFALSNIFVRKMQVVSVATKSAVNWSGVLLVAIIWILLVELPRPHIETTVLLGAVALGLLGFVVMTLAVQYGVSHMPVHRSAVILLFELVVGAVSSMWLAQEIISMQEWVGGVFVIAAALMSARVKEPDRCIA